MKAYSAAFDQEQTGIIASPSSGVLKERMNETATNVATQYVKGTIALLAPHSSKLRSQTHTFEASPARSPTVVSSQPPVVVQNTQVESKNVDQRKTDKRAPPPISTSLEPTPTSEPSTAAPASPQSTGQDHLEGKVYVWRVSCVEWTPRVSKFNDFNTDITSKLSNLIAVWGKGSAGDELIRCTTETASFIKKIIEDAQNVIQAYESYMKLCKATSSSGEATNKLVALSNGTKELVTLVKFRMNAPGADPSQPQQSVQVDHDICCIYVQEIISCSVSITRACKALTAAIENIDNKARQAYTEVMRRRQSMGVLKARTAAAQSSSSSTPSTPGSEVQQERQKLNEQIAKVVVDLRGLVARVQSKEKSMRSERRVHIAVRACVSCDDDDDTGTLREDA